MTLRPRPPAKGYTFVRVPDFVTRDEFGRIREIRCKICGKVISSVRSAVINRVIEADGRVIEQVETRLAYTSEYAEMVIDLPPAPGAKGPAMNHVTQGCRTCFAGKLKPDQLAELVLVDLREQGYDAIAPDDFAKRTQRKGAQRKVFDAAKLGIR